MWALLYRYKGNFPYENSCTGVKHLLYQYNCLQHLGWGGQLHCFNYTSKGNTQPVCVDKY